MSSDANEVSYQPVNIEEGATLKRWDIDLLSAIQNRYRYEFWQKVKFNINL